ncbi:DegT/DnrJ/EryC1/StrS family aminotransferase [Marinobacterium stanieri]|uniref:dTDP-4-amino-4,6-dideoxygalactose transaminase n=1 Tax=Marinobacterium stanieri TaxID=49186 RepID=A0A1N6SC02_9GAMM|nr:DegT/DnrJ/EryC1/StrS family aminotransferase [Marinobacterium stanieri]SIQ38683.1 dTDP-4-amino-4,6-dideoxygalactose transaminase [Marinobacterium stanieri]
MLRLASPNIPDEAIQSVVDVIKSGQLVHGAESEAFEKELASFLGCEHVVLVSSGTAALHISLIALGIGKGDAVIVPDFTFPASANAVAMCGAQPVFVDVNPLNYTIDTNLLEDVVKNWNGEEKLKAIMPVHEFGCIADMETIKKIASKYDLKIIEDAACALGSNINKRYAGTFGDLGCFSFHPRKTLTTGEGGAVATNCSRMAAKLRMLRNHGMVKNERGMDFIVPSTNYRLTNFQAAMGRKQLPYLESWINKRRALVNKYLKLLKPLANANLINTPEYLDGHSWQTFMIVLAPSHNRNNIIKKLHESGVEAGVGAQSMSFINIWGVECEVKNNSENLHNQGLALPLYEKMTFEDTEFVFEKLNKIMYG